MIPGPMPLNTYLDLRRIVASSEFHQDIAWSEGLVEPANAEDMATQAIWVICNSGMKHTVAQGIYRRVIQVLVSGRPVREAFGHSGKAAAIEHIWSHRQELYDQFLVACLKDAEGDSLDDVEAATAGGKAYRPTCAQNRLDFCRSLPWIGEITQFHLAKNLGVDCAKPDIWLVRLGIITGEPPHVMCARLARESGDRIATVDLVLWRCMARGWLKLDMKESVYSYDHRVTSEVIA